MCLAYQWALSCVQMQIFYASLNMSVFLPTDKITFVSLCLR